MIAKLTGTRALFTPMVNQATAAASQTILQVAQAEPQLSRTYYQDGRLLTALDLNRDYSYLDQRLLDLGMALGDGIVQGLVATLLADGVTISVTEGRGIAPSGRVIAYSVAPPTPAPTVTPTPTPTVTPPPATTTATLTANLADRATQATLNGPSFAGIADGLYAVVLLHGQQPRGVAEVFPRDLSSTRITYETIVDTVEIALVGLPQPIPSGTQFQSRAKLAAQFAGGSNPVLPSDSVALGVLSMRNGLVFWFDPVLLRHPLRPSNDANAVQDDLTRQYNQIYKDYTASLTGTPNFRAADVFPLLPPTGSLPKAAIDVTAATQTFFPEQFDVVLVPARTDEVAALLAQTAGEPAIDTTASTPAQILVLVPLAPAAYATLTPALVAPTPTTKPQAFTPYPTLFLPRIDPLVLRLPGRQPPSSPPSAWAQILAQAPANLPWMVRPTDGGLGGAIAAQLAVPPPPPAPTPTPAATNSNPNSTANPNSAANANSTANAKPDAETDDPNINPYNAYRALAIMNALIRLAPPADTSPNAARVCYSVGRSVSATDFALQSSYVDGRLLGLTPANTGAIAGLGVSPARYDGTGLASFVIGTGTGIGNDGRLVRLTTPINVSWTTLLQAVYPSSTIPNGVLSADPAHPRDRRRRRPAAEFLRRLRRRPAARHPRGQLRRSLALGPARAVAVLADPRRRRARAQHPGRRSLPGFTGKRDRRRRPACAAAGAEQSAHHAEPGRRPCRRHGNSPERAAARPDARGPCNGAR